MSDIGIYTTELTFDHKTGQGYWTFTASMPKVEEGDKFWVAWDGRWQGYSVVFKVIGRQVHFDGFEYVDDGGRVPFQGFTYKVPEVV